VRLGHFHMHQLSAQPSPSCPCCAANRVLRHVAPDTDAWQDGASAAPSSHNSATRRG
jgi:hypothetical protein